MFQESGEIISTPPLPDTQGNSILYHCRYLYQLTVLGRIGFWEWKIASKESVKGRKESSEYYTWKVKCNPFIFLYSTCSSLLINYFSWATQSGCFLFCLFLFSSWLFFLLPRFHFRSCWKIQEKNPWKTFMKHIMVGILAFRYIPTRICCVLYVINLFQFSYFWCLLYFNVVSGICRHFKRILTQVSICDSGVHNWKWKGSGPDLSSFLLFFMGHLMFSTWRALNLPS